MLGCISVDNVKTVHGSHNYIMMTMAVFHTDNKAVPSGFRDSVITDLARNFDLKVAVQNCAKLPELAWKIAEKQTFHGIREILYLLRAEFPFLRAEFSFFESEFPFSERRTLGSLLRAPL